MKKEKITTENTTSKKVFEIKNSKIIIASIAAILLIISVIILAFTTKDKDQSKENSSPSDDNQTVSKTTDYYIIMNYLKLNTLPDDYFGYFYKSKKTEIASLDNQLKLYMAIRQVISENADTQKYSDASQKIEIPVAEVEQEWKELFKDSKIKHESLKGDSCSYSAFIYDKKTKTYIQEPNPDHCTSRNEAIIAVVNDTVVNGNTIEIYENFGYVESNYNLETASISYNIYKDMAKTEKVATTTEFGITPYLEQLSTYKYTFEKNGNTYSFVKVELAQ